MDLRKAATVDEKFITRSYFKDERESIYPKRNSSKLNSKCHNSRKPAEVFRTDFITAMKMPDSQHIPTKEFITVKDTWRQEWERGVQVPVNPEKVALPRSRERYNELPFVNENPFCLPKEYVKFDQEKYNVAIDRSSTSCNYDLDDIDTYWLKSISDLRMSSKGSGIDEITMERAITFFERQCFEKMAHAVATKEGLSIEYDEHTTCHVCLSPDAEDGNEIIFCDACNMCAHQHCYGVPDIPEGTWLCNPCSRGILAPPCCLCPNKGGAMKRMKNSFEWIHVICAWWIPEVKIEDTKYIERITKDGIPTSRWNLPCVICHDKMGACIQCSVKRCVRAYHVTCAVKEGLEMKTVIIPNKDDVQHISFCSKHCAPVPPEDNPHLKKCGEDIENNRLRELRKLESEFYSLLSISKAVRALKVSKEAVCRLHSYWTMKRRNNGNAPLIKLTMEQQEKLSGKQGVVFINQQRTLEMERFLHLRQDLERLRNLCYMIVRREKMRKEIHRTSADVFYKQNDILLGEIEKQTETKTDIMKHSATSFTSFSNFYKTEQQLEEEIGEKVTIFDDTIDETSNVLLNSSHFEILDPKDLERPSPVKKKDKNTPLNGEILNEHSGERNIFDLLSPENAKSNLSTKPLRESFNHISFKESLNSKDEGNKMMTPETELTCMKTENLKDNAPEIPQTQKSNDDVAKADASESITDLLQSLKNKAKKKTRKRVLEGDDKSVLGKKDSKKEDNKSLIFENSGKATQSQSSKDNTENTETSESVNILAQTLKSKSKNKAEKQVRKGNNISALSKKRSKNGGNKVVIKTEILDENSPKITESQNSKDDTQILETNKSAVTAQSQSSKSKSKKKLKTNILEDNYALCLEKKNSKVEFNGLKTLENAVCIKRENHNDSSAINTQSQSSKDDTENLETTKSLSTLLQSSKSKSKKKNKKQKKFDNKLVLEKKDSKDEVAENVVECIKTENSNNNLPRVIQSQISRHDPENLKMTKSSKSKSRKTPKKQVLIDKFLVLEGKKSKDESNKLVIPENVVTCVKVENLNDNIAKGTQAQISNDETENVGTSESVAVKLQSSKNRSNKKIKKQCLKSDKVTVLERENHKFERKKSKHLKNIQTESIEFIKRPNIEIISVKEEIKSPIKFEKIYGRTKINKQLNAKDLGNRITERRVTRSKNTNIENLEHSISTRTLRKSSLSFKDIDMREIIKNKKESDKVILNGVIGQPIERKDESNQDFDLDESEIVTVNSLSPPHHSTPTREPNKRGPKRFRSLNFDKSEHDRRHSPRFPESLIETILSTTGGSNINGEAAQEEIEIIITPNKKRRRLKSSSDCNSEINLFEKNPIRVTRSRVSSIS